MHRRIPSLVEQHGWRGFKGLNPKDIDRVYLDSKPRAIHTGGLCDDEISLCVMSGILAKNMVAKTLGDSGNRAGKAACSFIRKNDFEKGTYGCFLVSTPVRLPRMCLGHRTTIISMPPATV